jgi:hypothetical protein
MDNPGQPEPNQFRRLVNGDVRMLPIVLRRLRVTGVAGGKGHHATPSSTAALVLRRRRLHRLPGGGTGRWTVERRQARGRKPSSAMGACDLY